MVIRQCNHSVPTPAHMSSLLPSYVFLLIPIESAFLAFHISVFFLTAQKLRKNRQFSHAFYTLFLLQCCSNYANYGLVGVQHSLSLSMPSDVAGPLYL